MGLARESRQKEKGKRKKANKDPDFWSSFFLFPLYFFLALAALGTPEGLPKSAPRGKRQRQVITKL
jgi:hypothetical protein